MLPRAQCENKQGWLNVCFPALCCLCALKQYQDMFGSKTRSHFSGQSLKKQTIVPGLMRLVHQCNKCVTGINGSQPKSYFKPNSRNQFDLIGSLMVQLCKTSNSLTFRFPPASGFSSPSPHFRSFFRFFSRARVGRRPCTGGAARC